MLKELTEGQMEWILQQIHDGKETCYTGRDFDEVDTCWDPDLYDMNAEELVDLKKLYEALTEKKDLGTITG